VPASGATTRCGSAHIDTRSEERPGAEVGRRNMAVSHVGERTSRAQDGLLLRHQELEAVTRDRRSLFQCLDEGHVMLCQELAEAG
jgi:hypothetical protein